MAKQIVHFFELPELYKILLELKDILSFDINNYQSKKELSNAITDNKLDFSNSIIVAKFHENLLIDNDKLDKKNILFIDKFPIQLDKLIDKINVHLIQHQYNFK